MCVASEFLIFFLISLNWSVLPRPETCKISKSNSQSVILKKELWKFLHKICLLMNFERIKKTCSWVGSWGQQLKKTLFNKSLQTTTFFLGFILQKKVALSSSSKHFGKLRIKWVVGLSGTPPNCPKPKWKKMLFRNYYFLGYLWSENSNVLPPFFAKHRSSQQNLDNCQIVLVTEIFFQFILMLHSSQSSFLTLDATIQFEYSSI